MSFSHHLADLDYSFFSFSEPFFPFSNDPILSEISYCHQYTQSDLLNPFEKIQLEDTFFNSSSPIHLMENLSPSQEITCLGSAFGTISGGNEKGWEVPTSLDENGRKIRRPCSTEDFQFLGGQKMLMENANLKMGRCGEEERKEKIQKYRAKRMHRNFNKTIKYVCRKTLANKRPRIRGRFARNTEAINIHYNNNNNNQNQMNELKEEEAKKRVFVGQGLNSVGHCRQWLF